MANVFAALVTVFGIMFLGALADRRRMFPSTMALCLNQFVYWVSLPGLLFTQMCTIPVDSSTRSLIWGTLVASLLTYALFYTVFSKGFRSHTPEASIRTLGVTFPNAAFFGLPFLMMVFPGNDDAVNANMLSALLYSGVFITADTTLQILKSGGLQGSLTLRVLRELSRNPMMIVTALAMVLRLTGITLPAPILKATSMLGSTAAPCALFSMGMVLSAQISGSLGPFSLRKALLPLCIVSAGKLLVYPLITFVILAAAGCEGILLVSATLTTAMPIAVMVYVVSERYDASPAEVSMEVIVTTVLSMFTLPVVLYLLELQGLVQP